MGIQEYRANYRAAFNEANCDLNEIYRQFEELQIRKEMIDGVVAALEPFLQSAEADSHSAHSETYRDVHVEEPVSAERLRVEPKHEVRVPSAVVASIRESITPAPFAPVPDIIVDPIQSRINRALGLAVA